MQEIYETIDILLDVYAYNHAWKIAEQHSDFPAQSRYLLEMLKERRELNVDFAFSHAAEKKRVCADLYRQCARESQAGHNADLHCYLYL